MKIKCAFWQASESVAARPDKPVHCHKMPSGALSRRYGMAFTLIASTFFITAAMFLGTSLYGYTTGRDLAGFGSFLTMGVIGLVVAMLVNMFLASPRPVEDWGKLLGDVAAVTAMCP